MIVLGAAYQAGPDPGRGGASSRRSPQRRLGGDEHAGLPRGPRCSSRPDAVGAATRGEACRSRRSPPQARRSVDVGATAASCGGCWRSASRADRLPGRPTRGATSTSSVACQAPRRVGRRHRAGRGGRALPAQADGLQGRVRGGAPAPRRRRARELERRVRPRAPSRYNLHPPLLRALGWSGSSSSARGSSRRSARSPDAPAARHAARPVRLRRGAPRRAGAGRRVPRAGRARSAAWGPAPTPRWSSCARCPTSSAATRTSSCATWCCTASAPRRS